MICLFPGIGPIGGVQVSGWEAWRAFEGIADRCAIVFGADQTGELSPGSETAIVAQNRFSLTKGKGEAKDMTWLWLAEEYL